MTNKQIAEEGFAKAQIVEAEFWSLTLSLKYMNAAWQKFLMKDEAQAKEVHGQLTELLKKSRNYDLNSKDDEVFTFESANGAITTIDIREVTAATVNPPYIDFFDANPA